jgi:hypothetical protein
MIQFAMITHAPITRRQTPTKAFIKSAMVTLP